MGVRGSPRPGGGVCRRGGHRQTTRSQHCPAPPHHRRGGRREGRGSGGQWHGGCNERWQGVHPKFLGRRCLNQDLQDLVISRIAGDRSMPGQRILFALGERAVRRGTTIRDAHVAEWELGEDPWERLLMKNPDGTKILPRWSPRDRSWYDNELTFALLLAVDGEHRSMINGELSG